MSENTSENQENRALELRKQIAQSYVEENTTVARLMNNRSIFEPDKSQHIAEAKREAMKQRQDLLEQLKKVEVAEAEAKEAIVAARVEEIKASGRYRF